MPGKTGDHVVTRFIRLIDPSTINGDGCWLWAGSIQDNGYARFNADGEVDFAHRVAYRLFCGPIPAGHDICHSCDIRACVRPDHLFPGTRLDNMRDAKAKGRLSRGDKHALAIQSGVKIPAAKLSPDAVRLIRARLSSGHKPAQIAKDFGVTAGAINAIRRGVTWSHIQ